MYEFTFLSKGETPTSTKVYSNLLSNDIRKVCNASNDVVLEWIRQVRAQSSDWSFAGHEKLIFDTVVCMGCDVAYGPTAKTLVEISPIDWLILWEYDHY
jgi:hypothetical protein